jgi:ribonuclease HII
MMGISEIVEVVRTKFGLRPDTPDSVTLTRALDDLSARIDKNRAKAAAVEATIPEAVIRSIDGAATERRKLQNLTSEHTVLVLAADATRRDLAIAREREEAEAIQAQWNEAQKRGDALIAAAQKVDAAAIAVAETLDGPLEELRAVHSAFRSALPDGYGTDYRYATDIARDGIALALDAIKVRVGNDESRIKKMQPLESIAKDEVYGRTLGNPSQPTERLKPPPRDHLGRRINELNQVIEG